MKILVLGDGLLGSEIVKQTGWDFVSRKKNGFDIINLNQWDHNLDKYDTIINCMAYTKTYENNKELNWNTNIVGVDNLIKYCNSHSKKLIHISTEYLYAGSISNASEEDTPVHVPTWYGYSKLVGDALIQLHSNNYLICRLCHKPNPFPYEYAWEDIKTNCDYVDIISKLVIKLIKNNCVGVFNVGTEIKSIYDLAKKTNPNIKSTNKPIHIPDDTSMNINKLKQII